MSSSSGSNALEQLRRRKSSGSPIMGNNRAASPTSESNTDAVKALPKFIELPIYFRDQGGEAAKFRKITSVWVGRDWTMSQVRLFLLESKSADSKHIFDWLPDRFRFFHPDLEEEISKSDEANFKHTSFKKSFIAVQARVFSDPKSPLKAEASEVHSANRSPTDEIQSKDDRNKKAHRRGRSVSSDVSLEANSLFFEVNSTFQNYPDKREEFLQVLDAYGQGTISNIDLKWCVEQLCDGVTGGDRILELFKSHLPTDSYELIIDDHQINNVSMEEEQSEKLADTSRSPQASPSAATNKRKKKKSRKKTRGSKHEKSSRSRSSTEGSYDYKHTNRYKDSSHNSNHNANRKPRRTRRSSRDSTSLSSGRSYGTIGSPSSEPSYQQNTSPISDTQGNIDSSIRRDSGHNEMDYGTKVESNTISKQTGETTLSSEGESTVLFSSECGGVVADVVSFRRMSSSLSIFQIQVLAMDIHGNAIERYTIDRTFSEFKALDKRLRQLVKPWHRPLAPMPDSHFMLSHLCRMNSSSAVMEPRLQGLSNYMRDAILCAQAAAVFNLRMGGKRGNMSERDSLVGSSISGAGDFWIEIANFLSSRKHSVSIVKMSAGCCGCGGLLSACLLAFLVIIVPLMSVATSVFIPKLYSNEENAILRVTYLVSAIRDAINFVILSLAAICMEGYREGCLRPLTADRLGIFSPVKNLGLLLIIGLLLLGWQTLYLLGLQYAMHQETKVPSESDWVKSSEFVLANSYLGMTPSLCLFISMLCKCCSFTRSGASSLYTTSSVTSRQDLEADSPDVGSQYLDKCHVTAIISGCILISGAAASTIFSNPNFPYTCRKSRVWASAVGSNSSLLESPATPSSLCSWKSEVLLGLSTCCLAAYIALTSLTVYSEPQRAFRPFTVTAWSSCFAMICSTAVFFLGSSSLPGGIDHFIDGLPVTFENAVLFGIAPSVVSSLFTYYGIAWLIINASGNVTSSLFGLPLIVSALVALGTGGTLPSVVLVCACIALIGMCIILGCQGRIWRLASKVSSDGKDSLDQSLLTSIA